LIRETVLTCQNESFHEDEYLEAVGSNPENIWNRESSRTGGCAAFDEAVEGGAIAEYKECRLADHDQLGFCDWQKWAEDGTWTA